MKNIRRKGGKEGEQGRGNEAIGIEEVKEAMKKRRRQ